MIIRYRIEQEKIILKEFLKQNHYPRHYQTHVVNHPGQFLVNNQNVANHYLLTKGDILEIVIPNDEEPDNIVPIRAPLNIVYEDSYLLILNKDSNLASIPTKKHFENSLANHVFAYYKEKGILSSIHFVNRLDASTSGLIILAKNSFVMTKMKETPIEKKYLLIVEGKVLPKEGIIDTFIERISPKSIIRKVSEKGEKAITLYKVLEFLDDTTLVEATLVTGRTHQIRVHFQSLGHPIVGDKLYGNGNYESKLLLHSYHINFIHPITKQDINLTIYPNWVQSHCSHS